MENLENMDYRNLSVNNSDQSNCLLLNSSGSTVTDDSFPEETSSDLLGSSSEASGYDSSAVSDPIIPSDNANIYDSGYEEINNCPATIHLLYTDLRNSLYYCICCRRYSSHFYADNRDDFFSDVQAFSEENIFETVFFGNNALKELFATNLQAGKNKNLTCKFCKKNGEIPLVYQGHELKNAEGKIVCPILRNYTCGICNATGDDAHTRKYCPESKRLFDQLPVFRRLANGIISTLHNHK